MGEGDTHRCLYTMCMSTTRVLTLLTANSCPVKYTINAHGTIASLADAPFHGLLGRNWLESNGTNKKVIKPVVELEKINTCIFNTTVGQHSWNTD